MKAPFPYFGNKARVAPRVWEMLGDPALYIEPFAGEGIGSSGGFPEYQSERPPRTDFQ